VTRLLAGFLGLCLGAVLANPAAPDETPTSQPARVHGETLAPAPADSGLPDGYVITPNGYFHKSCIVQIETGERVLRNGDIQRADGSIEKREPCRFPSYRPDRNGGMREVLPEDDAK